MTVNISANNEASKEWIVCTLFEGDYHLGVAALMNSLAESGYRGQIWAGYRGALPPWIGQLKRCGANDQYQIGETIRLTFLRVDTKSHFTNVKPEFMQRLISEQVECKYICYFDPDVTIRCAWEFFERWVKYGIALCEDITNGTMPANHPLRLGWKKMVADGGDATKPRDLSRYYNGGFIGLPTTCKTFLQRWQDMIRMVESTGVDLGAFAPGSRIDPFYATDQDALNVAAMYTDHQLTTIGPEGMGFVPGGFTMYHALGAPKPWRKKMIRAALRGVAPSPADKAFLARMNGPIFPYNRCKLMMKKTACNIGAFIGRFYGRR